MRTALQFVQRPAVPPLTLRIVEQRAVVVIRRGHGRHRHRAAVLTPFGQMVFPRLVAAADDDQFIDRYGAARLDEAVDALSILADVQLLCLQRPALQIIVARLAVRIVVIPVVADPKRVLCRERAVRLNHVAAAQTELPHLDGLARADRQRRTAHAAGRAFVLGRHDGFNAEAMSDRQRIHLRKELRETDRTVEEETNLAPVQQGDFICPLAVRLVEVDIRRTRILIRHTLGNVPLRDVRV